MLVREFFDALMQQAWELAPRDRRAIAGSFFDAQMVVMVERDGQDVTLPPAELTVTELLSMLKLRSLPVIVQTDAVELGDWVKREVTERELCGCDTERQPKLIGNPVVNFRGEF